MWGETEGKSNIMGRMGARQEYAAGAGLGPVLARSERVSLPGTRAERKKKNRQPARGLPEHGPLDSNYHSERTVGVGVGVAARVRERGAAPTALSCIPHSSVGARV